MRHPFDGINEPASTRRGILGTVREKWLRWLP